MTEQSEITVGQARRSVLVVALTLALLGAWQMYRSRVMAADLLWGAGAAVLMCAAVPAAAIRFHRYWMGLAAVLGYVNSRILLSFDLLPVDRANRRRPPSGGLRSPEPEKARPGLVLDSAETQTSNPRRLRKSLLTKLETP